MISRRWGHSMLGTKKNNLLSSMSSESSLPRRGNSSSRGSIRMRIMEGCLRGRFKCSSKSSMRSTPIRRGWLVRSKSHSFVKRLCLTSSTSNLSKGVTWWNLRLLLALLCWSSWMRVMEACLHLTPRGISRPSTASNGRLSTRRNFKGTWSQV